MSFFGNRRQAEPVHEVTQPKPELPAPSGVPQAPVGFETVLGANSTLEGTLRSSANIRLDGAFTGTLEITGNVLVGETAKITADINARNISIAGAVHGNISGKKVQLLRTGRVWGDIRAAALTTEEGAFIDGKITMGSPDNALNNSTVPSNREPAPTGTSQDEDYVRIVDGVTPVGMGATEEDPDDMLHEGGEPPTGYQDNPLVENISQDDPEVEAVQTDSAEGQAEEPTDEAPSDETRQST